MGIDLDINNKIQNYIQNLSQPLHPIQKEIIAYNETLGDVKSCLLYTSPSPRDGLLSRMPSSA